MTRSGLVLLLWIGQSIYFGNPVFSQEKPPNEKSDPKVSETEKKKAPPKGCCRIRYQGGGFDYFPATEEECVSKSNFDSFQKDSALCFQSLWD